MEFCPASGKIMFDDRAAARRASVAKAARTDNAANDIYRCVACGCWHLGRPTRHQRRARDVQTRLKIRKFFS